MQRENEGNSNSVTLSESVSGLNSISVNNNPNNSVSAISQQKLFYPNHILIPIIIALLQSLNQIHLFLWSVSGHTVQKTIKNLKTNLV